MGEKTDHTEDSAGYAAGGMVRGLDPASGLPYSGQVPVLVEPGVWFLTPRQVRILEEMDSIPSIKCLTRRLA